MSIRNLSYLFKPRSVALIGASDRPRAVGNVVMRNLLQGGFSGPIMPVNPKREAVSGVLAYPDISSLPVVPDLGIVCTPPATVPGIIEELGECGAHAAVLITAGLSNTLYTEGKTAAQATMDAARRYSLQQEALLGLNPDSQPTARHLKDIVDLAKTQQIKAVFFEELVNEDLARVLSQEIGAETLVLNPGANLTQEQQSQGVSFLDLMGKNLVNLKRGLGCQ